MQTESQKRIPIARFQIGQTAYCYDRRLPGETRQEYWEVKVTAIIFDRHGLSFEVVRNDNVKRRFADEELWETEDEMYHDIRQHRINWLCDAEEELNA